MDTDNCVIGLCIQGTQAEYKGQIDKACAFYEQAWEAAQDHYEACVAAHYVARHQDDPEERLRWNQIALDRANDVADGRAQAFYPSLFLNMGHSHELLGNHEKAKRYYDLAAEMGVRHQVRPPGGIHVLDEP
jgi:tetratricopeptide (TPR) repeat protein